MLKIENFDENIFDKIYVFGDLHGNYDLFIKMLEKIKFTKDDLIVILGDSCDRGKKTADLYYKYKELMENGYTIKHILGNHEIMMYKGGFCNDIGVKRIWRLSGGKNTELSFRKYPKFKSVWYGLDGEESLKWLKEWLEKMPHILISQSYIFVHAGYDGRVVEQNEDFVLWSRENFGDYNTTGKEIYHGHTPSVINQIHKRPNNVYSMDVGANFYKNLKILEIKSKTEFEVEI